MHLQENTMAFDLDFGVMVTRNAGQYPLHQLWAMQPQSFKLLYTSSNLDKECDRRTQGGRMAIQLL